MTRLALLVGCALFTACSASTSGTTRASATPGDHEEAAAPPPSQADVTEPLASDATATAESVEPSAPCAELPGARVVRIERVRSPRYDGYVVSVTPASESADSVTGGLGQDVGFDGDLRHARSQVTEVLFTPGAEAPHATPDCSAPGVCLGAIYVACSDGAHAEVVARGQHGRFRAEPLPRSGADGTPDAWANLVERRTEGDSLVDITWTWTGVRYERSAESPRVVPPPPPPSVGIDERTAGMPAISGDGRRVVDLHSWGTELEGTGETYMDFRVHRVRDGQLLRTIRLHGEDVDGESLLSHAEQRRAYQLVNALLTRGRFRAMTPLESLYRSERYLSDGSGAGVRLVHRAGTFHVTGAIEAEHTPAGLPTTAYCCGLDDGDDPDALVCELPPVINGAWADATARVILVAHEVTTATSGCETLHTEGLFLHGSSAP